MAPPPTPLARTPLHDWHARHGARFVVRDGWQVVASYAEVDREVEAARSGLALADISAFAKLSLRGRGVADLARVLAGDGAANKPGGVSSLSGNETVLACRLTEEHLLLLAGTSRVAELEKRLENLSQAVMRIDLTSAAGFCLLGPHAEALLRSLTHLDVRLAALPSCSCAETAFAGVEALLVRVAESPLPVCQVFVPWDLGEYVWERMMDEGRRWQIAPAGLDSLAALQGTLPQT